MNSCKIDKITTRRLFLLFFLGLFVICQQLFAVVRPFTTEFHMEHKHNRDKNSDNEEISTKPAVSHSNISAPSYGELIENYNSTRSMLNVIVPKESSSASTNNDLISITNDIQMKPAGIGSAKELGLLSKQSDLSSMQRIGNDSSFDPVAEINVFRQVMDQISRNEFNYSIFLNDINKNQNRTQERKWLVRK